MSIERKIKLFLVDDDALFLKSLEIDFMENGGYEVETFSTGEQCLRNIAYNPDIIVLDYHLDSIVGNAMNGIAILDQLKESHPNIPVVMLSSQDNIEIAVKCIHHKAYDYVVKSETCFLRLENIIASYFSTQTLKHQINWYMDRM
jgi:two-component system, OmpR family, response regulator